MVSVCSQGHDLSVKSIHAILGSFKVMWIPELHGSLSFVGNRSMKLPCIVFPLRCVHHAIGHGSESLERQCVFALTQLLQSLVAFGFALWKFQHHLGSTSSTPFDSHHFLSFSGSMSVRLPTPITAHSRSCTHFSRYSMTFKSKNFLPISGV